MVRYSMPPRMIQRVPVETYFIIRPSIGVKWSFDVYNTSKGSEGLQRATTPRGNVICDLGGACLPTAMCPLLPGRLSNVAQRLLFFFFRVFASLLFRIWERESR